MTDIDIWQQMEFDLGLPRIAEYTFALVPCYRKESGELYHRCPKCRSKSNRMSFHQDNPILDPADDKPCWMLWLSQPYFADPGSNYSEPTPLPGHMDLTCNNCYYRWVGSPTEVAVDEWLER